MLFVCFVEADFVLGQNLSVTRSEPLRIRIVLTKTTSEHGGSFSAVTMHDTANTDGVIVLPAGSIITGRTARVFGRLGDCDTVRFDELAKKPDGSSIKIMFNNSKNFPVYKNGKRVGGILEYNWARSMFDPPKGICGFSEGVVSPIHRTHNGPKLSTDVELDILLRN